MVFIYLFRFKLSQLVLIKGVSIKLEEVKKKIKQTVNFEERLRHHSLEKQNQFFN